MKSTTDRIGDDERLAYLNDLSDYEVAEGEPDVRGWTVQTPSGDSLGTVSDLLVDTEQMKARYLEVQLDQRLVAGGGRKDCTLVPIGAAQIREDPDRVVVSVEAAAAADLPLHTTRERPTREHEVTTVGFYGRTPPTATSPTTRPVAAGGARDTDAERRRDDFYDSSQFDDRKFLGDRERRQADAGYLARRKAARKDKPG